MADFIGLKGIFYKPVVTIKVKKGIANNLDLIMLVNVSASGVKNFAGLHCLGDARANIVKI